MFFISYTTLFLFVLRLLYLLSLFYFTGFKDPQLSEGVNTWFRVRVVLHKNVLEKQPVLMKSTSNLL